MSAIKLPVRAYRRDGKFCDVWAIRDAGNVRLADSLSEPQAKQITIALNLHDELIEALKAAIEEVRMLDDSCYTYRTGRAVLVRAENQTETKP